MKKYLCLSLALLTGCSMGTPGPADKADEPALAWQSVQTGTGASGAPETEVKLVNTVLGMEYYKTTCTGLLMEAMAVNTVTSAVCWWAGGGDQYAVVESGSTLLVQSRWVDEEGGFGPWETKATIE